MIKALNTLSPAGKKWISAYNTTHHLTDITRCERVCVWVGVWVCGCVGVWVCGRVGVWEEGGAVREEAGLPAPRTDQITKL